MVGGEECRVKTGRRMESYGKNLKGMRVVPASEGRVKAKDLSVPVVLQTKLQIDDIFF